MPTLDKDKADQSSSSSIQDATAAKQAGGSSRPVLRLVNEGLQAGTSLIGRAATVPFMKNKQSAVDSAVSVDTKNELSNHGMGESATTPSNAETTMSTYASAPKESTPNPPTEPKPDAELQHTRYQTSTFILGPISEFLFRDSTLFMIVPCVAVTTYLLKVDWLLVSDGDVVPTQACASLILLAFLLGRESKHLCIRGENMTGSNKTSNSKMVTFDDERQDISSFRGSFGRGDQVTQTHTFFRSLVNNLTKANINFGPKIGIRVSRGDLQTSIRSSLQKLPPGRTPKPFWKENLDRSSDLMQSLLRNPKFKRSGRATPPSSSDDEVKSLEMSEVHVPTANELKGSIDSKGSVQLGPIDFDKAQPTKRNGDAVIEPYFLLRGIDVFLTTDGNPQERIWQLSPLKAVGLRTKPTFCINCLLPWANFVAYFAMPPWFTDMTRSLEVKEGDTPDEVALKMFLKASAQQKTDQFSLRPCLVEGPLPIRMMASPGEEYEVGSEYLPMQWHLDEGRVDEAPLLGLDIDCTSDKALRTAASLAKRYLCSVKIDVGVVIENEDIACCLGLFRMDKIDTKTCPELPEHTVEEDIHRASAVMLGSSRSRPC